MKPNAIYELSSVFSFFLRETGIESINLRYFGFFHKDYDKHGQLGKLLGLTRSDKPNMNIDLIAASWKNIPKEEFNFCLTRLSKYLSNKEKICTLLLLLDLCYRENIFRKQRFELLESIAKKIAIDHSWLLKLKKLYVINSLEPNKNAVDGNILLLNESEFYSWQPFPIVNNRINSKPALGYIYLQEEMLALIIVFEKKSSINGYPIELNKIYPMSEGDVLTCSNKLLSFNGLFRHYYNCAQFASLQINATETTPEVNFDSRKNNLEITGCSVPENGMHFYSKLSNWIENYLLTNPNHIKVNIRLDYFNTTSSKCILDLLYRLQSYKTDDIELQINWFFQNGDEDLEEAGLNYSEMVKIPFTLIPYN